MTEWQREYLDAWNRRDLAALADHFAADATYQDMVVGEVHRGRDAILDFVGQSVGASPDLRFEHLGGVDAEGTYAFEWRMTPLEVPGVSFGRRIGGKIVENRDYWDGTALLRARGKA